MKTTNSTLKKGLKKICCSFLVLMIISINATPVFASEENIVVSENISDINSTEKAFVTSDGTPDIKGEIYTEYLNEFSRGKNPPTGTSYINLSYNTMTCKCNMSYVLYSNSFFSGVTKAEVFIPEIKVDTNGMSDESGPVTVHLRKKGDSNVDVTGKISIDGGSVHYINLDSKALYYLEFEKKNDTQIYEFMAYVTEDE
ncbi:MAG: hypothetical protein HFG65_01130 [Hungatella sp.]|nr:hypothetical protein [Hungatella sp.]